MVRLPNGHRLIERRQAGPVVAAPVGKAGKELHYNPNVLTVGGYGEVFTWSQAFIQLCVAVKINPVNLLYFSTRILEQYIDVLV